MIVLDVKTSGIDERVHSLVSIGAVDFEHPEQQFYEECRIWNGAVIDTRELAKNGLTPEEVTDPAKITPGELMARFVAWGLQRSERTLAGHNPRMAYNFCYRVCRHEGISWPFGDRLIDLHSICWAHMANTGKLPDPVNGTSDVASELVHIYTGLPSEPKLPNGLNGAKWEAESLCRIVYGRNLLPEFQEYPLPFYTTHLYA